MTTNLLEVILSNTFTKNQAEKKIIVLKNFLLNNIFAISKKKVSSEAITDNPKLALWVENLDKSVLSSVTPQNIYEIFEKMETEVKAIEPLVLYLPYELPEEEINQIGTTLRKDYGPKFLIEISIDPNLIAGCALSYKGIYKDYSVRQKITDNKQEILAIFKNYVKH